MAKELTLAQFGGTYTADHGMLRSNTRVSKRAANAYSKRESDRAGQSAQRASEYYAGIRSGEIVDPSGRHTRAAMIRYEIAKAKDSIEIDRRHIAFAMQVHPPLKSGKLRASVQRMVDGYEAKIASIEALIALLEAELLASA